MWSRRATARQLVVLEVVAVVFLAALSLAWWHGRPADRRTTTEANVYFRFADPIARDRAFPYRDVTVEYPPGSLPVMLVPIWLRGDTTGARWGEEAENGAAERYESGLALTLWLLLAATITVTAASLALLGASLGHATVALGVQAASPLLLGALPLTRLEAWPVLLTSLALLAALAGRRVGTGVALGVAATAKLYPLVALPVLVARAWREGGRRAAVLVGAGAAGAALVVVGPFLALAPDGTIDSIRLQLSRGLQMESTGGSLLAAAWKTSLSLDNHGVLGPLPVGSCQHCGGLVAAQLTGTLADLVGVAALAAVLVVIVFAVRRSVQEDGRDAVVLGTVTSVAALVALGKVLSAQYLLWLLPLVPLVAGRRGRWATGLLAVACAMTNVWFPKLYREYVNNLDSQAMAFLLMRNALLLAMLAVLLWPIRRSKLLPSADSG